MIHDQLRSTFHDIIVAYLRSDDETELYRASEIGRALVDQGIGPDEAVAVYLSALESVLEDLPPARALAATARSYALLLEAIMAYSLIYREYVRETARRYERIRAYSQQIEARDRDLQAVFDTIQDGLVLLDPEYRVRLINAPGAQLIQASPTEIVGQIFPSERLPFPAEPMLTTLRRQEAGAQHASEWQTEADGRSWEVSVVPVCAVEQVQGILIVIRDVTQRHELDRLKEELIGLTVHEIRSPLGIILGFSELLLTRELKRHEVVEYARYIYEEADRLNRLVSDFLDIHRLEQGTIIPRREPLALGALCTNVIEAFSVTAPQHRFVLDVPPDLPAVLADRLLIEQALTNLVSNAITYSPQGGEIRIAAQHVGTEIVVSVADAGLGIPAECLPRLFTKFYRILTPDRRHIKGTGLGLAICRQIAEVHGGRIWAESAGPNQGSTFSFALPLSPPGEITAAPTTAS